MQLVAGHEGGVLHAQIDRQLEYGHFGGVCRDVRCERQVFDQSARFALWSVRRAQHAPVRGLQGARSADFTRFFELRVDAGHHAQARDVGKAGELLRDPLPLHFESLQTPITRLYRIFQPFGDVGGIDEL